MTHSFSISGFIEQNYVELRKMAGAVLRYDFSDDDIDDLLSNLTLDLHRLELLKKYDPEACKKFGVTLSTVVYRQFKNVLSDRALYHTAKKRTPDPDKLEAQHAWSLDRVFEKLAVTEFIDRLEPTLSELLISRMHGVTGPEYAAERGLHRMAAVKRTLKIREKWIQYAEN